MKTIITVIYFWVFSKIRDLQKIYFKITNRIYVKNVSGKSICLS